MIKETSKRNPVPLDLAMRHRRNIDGALQTLNHVTQNAQVARDLASVLGDVAPLEQPMASDVAQRTFLAKRLSETIAEQNGNEQERHCMVFDLFSPAWDCDAHRPIVPFRNMIETAVKPLKRQFTDHLWAVKPTIVPSDEGDRMRVRLRVVARVESGTSTAEHWLAGFRQRLDPSNEITLSRPVARLMRRGVVQQEIAQFLELDDRAPFNTIPEGRSDFEEYRSLYRSLVLAVLPLKSVVGGHGLLKHALSLCLKEAKAHAVVRANSKPLAGRAALGASEVYGLISDIGLMANEERVRAPVWKL